MGNYTTEAKTWANQHRLKFSRVIDRDDATTSLTLSVRIADTLFSVTVSRNPKRIKNIRYPSIDEPFCRLRIHGDVDDDDADIPTAKEIMYAFCDEMAPNVEHAVRQDYPTQTVEFETLLSEEDAEEVFYS